MSNRVLTVNDFIATKPFPAEQATTKKLGSGLIVGVHNTGLVALTVVAEAKTTQVGYIPPGARVLVRAQSSAMPWAKEIIRDAVFGDQGKDGVILVPVTAIVGVDREGGE